MIPSKLIFATLLHRRVHFCDDFAKLCLSQSGSFSPPTGTVTPQWHHTGTVAPHWWHHRGTTTTWRRSQFASPIVPCRWWLKRIPPDLILSAWNWITFLSNKGLILTLLSLTNHHYLLFTQSQHSLWITPTTTSIKFPLSIRFFSFTDP